MYAKTLEKKKTRNLSRRSAITQRMSSPTGCRTLIASVRDEDRDLAGVRYGYAMSRSHVSFSSSPSSEGLEEGLGGGEPMRRWG